MIPYQAAHGINAEKGDGPWITTSASAPAKGANTSRARAEVKLRQPLAVLTGDFNAQNITPSSLSSMFTGPSTKKWSVTPGAIMHAAITASARAAALITERLTPNNA